MTIKQHGGVFGRNPKFNSVEAESLSIAGNAVPDASTILVDGDIGSTVQGYDADTAKLDVAQTFTAAQTFDENIVMANTKGIDFSATGDGSGTTSSELFDDYEEGTFTPTVIGSSSAGTGTYSQQNGEYTKSGRLVHAAVRINWSAHTGTGNIRITGLPFAAQVNEVVNIFANGLTYTGTHLQPFLVGSEIWLNQTSSNSGDAYIAMDTSCQLFLTAIYYTG